MTHLFLQHRPVFWRVESKVKVVHVNQVTLKRDTERWQPKYLVIRPRPMFPTEAGISIPAINHFGKNSLIGRLSGHRAIGQAFAAKLSA